MKVILAALAVAALAVLALASAASSATALNVIGGVGNDALRGTATPDRMDARVVTTGFSDLLATTC